MASRLDDTYQGTGDDYKYPSYFDAVIEEATKTYGLSEDEIVKNGYKIYTEMDANSQANMQQTYEILISSLHQKVMVVQLSQLVWHLIQQLELSVVW